MKSESLGRCSIFSLAHEKEIVDDIFKLANLFFELRTMIFKYAEHYNNFNKDKQMAGKDWY